MKDPLISVLVPVHNSEKYLAKCLDSIISQTYKNLEIIVVNDGSCDNSGTICDNYALKDCRIKVFHQTNQGIASTRNSLLEKASGEYIASVDSDDVILPDMYSEMMKTILETNADIVLCNFDIILPDGTVKESDINIPFEEGEITAIEYIDTVSSNYCGLLSIVWNKLYKRHLFENIHYPDGKIHEDDATIHRIIHKCNKIFYLNKRYYRYRKHKTSIMNTPKVSILVPVYNVEKYLEECLESLINQTYQNLEIILVDDGSTDNSGIICDEYAKKDSRIKVIHQKNQGLATVRNVSVAATTGDYIGFVDSDDFISPDMYSDMVLLAQEKEADIVMCNLGYVDQDGKAIPNYRSAKLISDRELTGKQFVTELCREYNSIYVVTVDKLYRRNLFEGVRYPDGKINEDEAVIHRIAHKCNKIAFTSKAYYFYRQQPTSIMNKGFSLKRFDGICSLLDRIDFLNANEYPADVILKSKLYLIHRCTTLFKQIDVKNTEHKKELNKYHKIIKPFCKELLKSTIPTKSERIMLFFVKTNPFLYLKIFNRKRK